MREWNLGNLPDEVEEGENEGRLETTLDDFTFPSTCGHQSSVRARSPDRWDYGGVRYFLDLILGESLGHLGNLGYLGALMDYPS